MPIISLPRLPDRAALSCLLLEMLPPNDAYTIDESYNEDQFSHFSTPTLLKEYMRQLHLCLDDMLEAWVEAEAQEQRRQRRVMAQTSAGRGRQRRRLTAFPSLDESWDDFGYASEEVRLR